MAERKQFQSSLTVAPELEELLRQARRTVVSEDEFREQRISVAYGNAPPSDLITKESVRWSAANTRLK